MLELSWGLEDEPQLPSSLWQDEFAANTSWKLWDAWGARQGSGSHARDTSSPESPPVWYQSGHSGSFLAGKVQTLITVHKDFLF